jgi:2'-5' RNA ligase
MNGPLFLAITPDQQTRSVLAQMFAPFGLAGRLPGKLSAPDNWHITVRFLGSHDAVTVDRLTAELDQAEWSGPFKINLTGFGAFPNGDNATVLWAGVDSEALGELAAAVEEIVITVGIEPEDRPYRPHLTLSRIRPPLDVNDLLEDSWGRLTFTADELVLYESRREGQTHYHPIEVFPL